MRSENTVRTAVRIAVREFVEQRAQGLSVEDTTPLFTLRILRSIHLPELIILLERLRGAPIDVERLTQGDFDSIDTIVQRWGDPA